MAACPTPRPRPFLLASRCLRLAAFAIVLAASLPGNPAQGQLKFNFTPASGMSQDAKDGFAAAGARWSALFNDNVTVNINIDFTNLGSGILGQASSTRVAVSYTSARTALMNDATSVDDGTSSNALQSSSSLNLLINGTRDNPNGAGSLTPYFDGSGANNTTLRITTANAKAVGLYTGSSSAADAQISFSSSFAWDFNPNDGITAGQYDFVGVATHEIGHALGFISGVDVLDGNLDPPGPPNSPGPYSANLFTYVTTMDLFRFSSRSIDADSGGGTGVIDWTADAADKYFSVDGGLTQLALFSTGINYGDGEQASHWKDNLNIGIMDPTAAAGTVLNISAMDARLLDVIGWNLVSVPEPGSLLLLGAAAGLAFAMRRRRAA